MRPTFLLLLAAIIGCGEHRECTYDVDCPIGSRCLAAQCILLRGAPPADAAPDPDAASRDASSLADSGSALDAGLDASVEGLCELSVAPPEGVVVGTAASTADAPVLVRAGLGLFGLVVRTDAGIVADYIDEAGLTVLGPIGPLNPLSAAEPDVAATAASDGSIAVVWRESDEFLHGALVSDLGAADLGLLTEGATGTNGPSVARSSDGFAIAWADREDATERLSTRSLDDQGVALGSSVRFGTPGVARMPVLVDDSAADLPLVWSDARSGAPQPYAGTRRADGSIIGETLLSAALLLAGLDAVATQFGLFVSWVEPPPQPNGKGAVHVTRLEQDTVRDRVIARASGLDGRTSIGWDGDRALVGWHRGHDAAAEVTVAAIRPDLSTASSLTLLGANSARPTLAADDSLKGVVWLDATTADVRFGVLSCE